MGMRKGGMRAMAARMMVGMLVAAMAAIMIKQMPALMRRTRSEQK
ncbi:hypothetical protein ACTIVE_3927 [Actinomadura verrucosospora]|uniref:Uncharacterized protein n=2 Tax=Actinomadura TaxID=1988 RepID=A0A7D4AQ14_ACTVE|nr:hypothetical protein ACTIVE_3927 [Actinomadura verrucosospora]